MSPEAGSQYGPVKGQPGPNHPDQAFMRAAMAEQPHRPAGWPQMPSHPTPDDLSERIADVLRGQGIPEVASPLHDSDIHSWRCAYPEQYGACSCFADLVAEIRSVV